MTQALMDLGPRLDPKPAAGQGDSRGSAGSGAAFAEAVDQAVSETRSRREAPERGGSDDDRPTSSASDRRADSSGAEHAAEAAAATVVWALTPHDLRAAQTPTAGPAGGGVPNDGPDVAVTGRALRSTDAAAETAHRSAAVHDTASAAPQHATSNGHAVRATPATPATTPTPTVRDGVVGRSKAGAASAGKSVAGAAAAHHAPHSAPEAAAEPGSAPAAVDLATSGATAASTRAGTTAAAADGTAAETPRQVPADAGRTRLAIDHDTSDTPASPEDADRPGRADHARSRGAASSAAHAAANSAAGSAANAAGDPTTSSASSATNAAAGQVSPTSVHAPTAVAATVNGTPVAVPAPTPFVNAQPDVANILAQLRGRSDGTYQLRAQVHPAELGAVAITATVHHGSLTVTLAPDQAAQQAISQSLPQLRQHLADQGFTGVNVGLGSPDQSGQHGQGGGDRGSRAQGSDHSSLHGPDVAIGAADPVSARRAAGPRSALDLML